MAHKTIYSVRANITSKLLDGVFKWVSQVTPIENYSYSHLFSRSTLVKEFFISEELTW
jgi:hypothetical protein